MRTTSVLPCQSWLRSASTTFARAAGFSRGAQASSRSRNTSSAALSAAFSIIRGLLPGTARTERRSRARIDVSSGRSGAAGSVGLVSGRRWPVVGWELAVVGGSRKSLAAAEEASEHTLQVLGSAEVVLDALEEAGHQLLQLRVLGELLLKAAELRHQVLDGDLLGHLHEDGLRRGRDHHLHLLPDHLEAPAGDAGPLVLAVAELRLELVQLPVQSAQVNPRRFVAHSAIVPSTCSAPRLMGYSPRRREPSGNPAVDGSGPPRARRKHLPESIPISACYAGLTPLSGCRGCSSADSPRPRARSSAPHRARRQRRHGGPGSLGQRLTSRLRSARRLRRTHQRGRAR